MSDQHAPDGFVWVCHACGKTTKDRYGSDRGWDESCMLNSALHAEIALVIENGRVVRIGEAKKIVEP